MLRLRKDCRRMDEMRELADAGKSKPIFGPILGSLCDAATMHPSLPGLKVPGNNYLDAQDRLPGKIKFTYFQFYFCTRILNRNCFLATKSKKAKECWHIQILGSNFYRRHVCSNFDHLVRCVNCRSEGYFA